MPGLIFELPDRMKGVSIGKTKRRLEPASAEKIAFFLRNYPE
jgi:hypothetical protein